MAYCPERIFPGNAINELIKNDRIVGGLNKNSAELAKEFYSLFCRGDIKISDHKTAELAKLTENSFRDVNIAFANEISMICDHLNVDVSNLIELVNCHPRVNVLKPGCGVGGHCIAIDPWFLVASCPENTNLIRIARKVNNCKSDWVIEKIIIKVNELRKRLKREPNIGCLGLAFKPNIDDLRESPASLIVESLIKKDLKILTCEPNIEFHKKFKLYSLSKILKISDLIVILVAHDDFKNIRFNKEKVLNFCGLDLS